jgi:ech hydrogenase subunit F
MFDMIGNVLKNLTSKPATRKYPYEKREPFKSSRGKVSGIGIEDCIFCGICSRKCPSDAIVVNKAEKSWEIDPYKCIICGVCSEACPKKCILMSEEYNASSYIKEKLKYIQQPKPAEETK